MNIEAQISLVAQFCPMGTLSHGTYSPDDLIPTFYDALGALVAGHCIPLRSRDQHNAYLDALGPWAAKRAAEARQWAETLTAKCGAEGLDFSDYEEAYDLLDELFDALNEFAPEGVYFGALEGDGSDFGFWSNPEA
jgi:hypothetical protein